MKTGGFFGAFLAVVLGVLPGLARAQLTYFPIATNGAAISFASDGSNYLVGVGFPSTDQIAAQLLSSDGSKLGSLIQTGRTGISPAVAFDGNNYLMVWEDDELGSLDENTGWQVYGQLITKAGVASGAPFAISSTGIMVDGINTVAFGGGKYLVTYTRLINPALGETSGNRYVAGRIVNPNKTLGSEFRISPGFGTGGEVAFDDTNFFVVWCEDVSDTEIRGRFIHPSGFLAPSDFSVNASPAPSDNPKAVAFDGTNYLVVWNDEVAGAETGTWDCFGQRVDSEGSLVGSAFAIAADPGPQMATSVAFDGENFMAVWVDMQNETDWDMHARYIGTNGSLVGEAFAISTAAGNQLGGAGFANGNYLALVNNGVEMGEGGIVQSDSATGAFIVPTPPPVGEYFSDDFDDNAKDPARWGEDIYVDAGLDAFLAEANGHLEFTGSDSGKLRPWVGSFGSYTQNWEAAMDVHVGNLALPPWVPDNSPEVSMFLAVVDADDAELAHHLSMNLELRSEGPGLERGFRMDSAANNNELQEVPNYGYLSTAALDSRMRIAFDAATKILSASCNCIPMGWIDVDQAETDWGMGAGSRFLLAPGGFIGGFTNSGHEVYADNFVLRTGNDLDYLLTVGNGSGSGSYTNGAGIAIAAATAPAGKVFERWVGSTQYLANPASASTTVAMPAHAIKVVASYKLVGAATGDDFNDNAKDAGKWGEDIYFWSTNTLFQETHGRLEFLKAAGVYGDSTLRPWVKSVGSYTQSWETAMDAHVGELLLPETEDWLDSSISLIVFNRNDTNLLGGVAIGDGMEVSLCLELGRWDGNPHASRGYEMSAWVDGGDNLDGYPSFAYLETADRDGRLRISFDAATKVLTAPCNGRSLGWIDIDASGSDWDMAGSDTFGFVIGGSISSTTAALASGLAYADNFAVVGAVAPPIDGNGNGLPDWWEKLYFDNPFVQATDLCANGYNTVLDAYVAGFDPTDPNGWFGITRLAGNTIEWGAVSGRVYSIYWTANLPAGFQLLESNWTGGTYTDTLHVGQPKGFYKIEAGLAP